MSGGAGNLSAMRVSWVQPEDLLSHELVAARDLGKDVSKVTWRWLDAGGSLGPSATGVSPGPASPELHALADRLLDALDEQPMPPRPGEPDDLDGIRAMWRDVPRWEARVNTTKLHAAWVGRAVGCLLGRAAEHGEAAWPPADPAEAMRACDDLTYTLLALRLVERVGPDFTTEDVAQAWLDELPAGRVFTAERIAYRNLLLGYTPPQTALRANPFREWIGAQIRADLYGWIHPGRPDLAAACAYQDATVSHVRAGVYGALWVAAMSSAALTASSVDEVLDAGESVVPPVSRFANAVMDGRDLASREKDWDEVVDAIHARYGQRHWVHVLPNAALVAAALAFHGGDFADSVRGIVAAGCDTDSNGATVGAITAALAGGVPVEWSAPLRDTLHTSIPGSDRVAFTELAERTVKVSR
jgi:ADP-ribosylglycohydrolase